MPLHDPKSGRQPAPQYPSASPQNPCSEQQLPNLEPRHVMPFPQVPSVLTASDGVSGVVPPLPSSARQYFVPVTSSHDDTDGLLLRNCDTVIPCALDTEAQVSPALAVYVLVHARGDNCARAEPILEKMPRARSSFEETMAATLNLTSGINSHTCCRCRSRRTRSGYKHRVSDQGRRALC